MGGVSGRSGIGLLLLTVSLGAQSPAAQESWPISEAPRELRDTIARADLIVLSLQNELLRELTRALDQGGPALAIESCHVNVAGLTQRIGRQGYFSAGRTSDRLRNRANRPPPWSAALVSMHAGKKAGDVDGFVVDLGHQVGVLRPIAERPLCASCHGPVDRLDPAVRARLATRYPADRATGFKEGEIRGWFWVEVPKAGR